MEAIKATARKNKKGIYKIELPADTGSEDVIDVMVIIEKKSKANSNGLSKFIGKFSNKIDWLAYQKEIRNEWD